MNFRTILTICALTISITSYGQLADDPNDFIALKTFYDSTGGSSTWTNTTGWSLVADNATQPPGTDLASMLGVEASGGRVTILKLISNGLSGHIPQAIMLLSELEQLSLQDSVFSGPTNNQIGGSIPDGLTSLIKLSDVNFNSNLLTGPIPVMLSNMAKLEKWRTSNNHLTGTIPSDLCDLDSLFIFDIQGNDLMTPIPADIADCDKLRDFILTDNQITGTFPSTISSLTNLQALYLGNTQLGSILPGASIPDFFGNIPSLIDLRMNDNNLVGAIPATFINLVNLKVLDLKINSLTGDLPDFIGTFLNMQVLRLSNNLLTGDIDDSYGNLISMFEFNVSNNMLTGPIPSTLSSWINIGTFSVNDNNLSGTLPDYFDNFPLVYQIRFNNNQFTDSIPASYGDIPSLDVLRIHDNQLSGCFDPNLINLCDDEIIVSAYGNSFPIPWTDFCNEGSGSGACSNGSTTFCDISNGLTLQLDVRGNACVDGVLNASQAFQLTPLDTAPTNPAIGMMYMDATDNKLKVWDGSFWRSCW